MADKTYKIIYIVDNSKALKGIAELERALLKLAASEQKVAGTLKNLGQNMPGIRIAAAELRKLVAESAKAEAALKKVGSDNRSVTSLTNRLKELDVELKSKVVDAAAAEAALKKVGQGVKLPTGGGGAGSAGGGLLRQAGIGITRHAAYAAFQNTISSAGEGSRERRQFFSGATDMASAYRKDLQELAVLQGKTHADNETISGDLGFQKQTLLNPEDSRTFRLEFGGAIAPALKARGADGSPNITPGVARELEAEAGKFTARYGLDATTGGRMAGLLGVTHKVPSAAAGLGILEQTMEQLNIEGVGPVKGMANQLLALSGGMLEEGGGRFKDYREMGARFAASTVNQAGSSARAKTRIIQSDRLLRKFNGGDEEAFLRKIGITPDDDYESAIRKIEPHIKGKNGDQVLMNAGFGNSTERLAVIEEAKMNSIVDKQIAGMLSPQAAQAQAVARNNEFPSTVTGRQQAAENAEFAATVGEGVKGEPLKAARANARARMIAEGRLKPRGIYDSLEDKLRSGITSFGGVSGEDLNVDREAVDELRREGRKVGVDIDGQFPRLDITRGGRGMKIGGWETDAGTDESAFQSEFSKASGAIDAAKNLKKAAGFLNAAADGLNQQQDGGGRGGDPGPNAGNGGAGVNPRRP